ncbi:hypothetical protein OSB04_019443 [Centaurea solstitialis]|uniref:Uncharacterized protein n=1 Tax=Centaurea solstitialis TaxID=347529 RepID=A0AA38SQB6_9ASTR|nr:hypothetical protein OSB04_019443 [Centaurea solstitialis]
MESSSSDTMIRLTPTNYNMWKPRIEDLLSLKDLAEPLFNKGAKPAEKKDKQWANMNRKTCFPHVTQEQSAYSLWEKLESMYQAKTARNKTLLMRRLVNHKLNGGTSVTEHTNEEQAILLLSSLPDSWETRVVTLSNSTPNGNVTMQMVTNALINEEAQRREAKTNHYGHKKRDCRKFRREQPQISQDSNKEDGETMVTMSSDIALVTYGEETCLHVGSQDIEWVIDTAASFHATPHQDLFMNY